MMPLQAIHALQSRAVYTAIVIFITMVALALANIAYTNHVDGLADERNKQRARDFCDVVVLIDDRNRQVPPKLPSHPTAEQQGQYDVAVRFVAAMHAYRLKLGC